MSGRAGWPRDTMPGSNLKHGFDQAAVHNLRYPTKLRDAHFRFSGTLLCKEAPITTPSRLAILSHRAVSSTDESDTCEAHQSPITPRFGRRKSYAMHQGVSPGPAPLRTAHTDGQPESRSLAQAAREHDAIFGRRVPSLLSYLACVGIAVVTTLPTN